MNDAIPAHAQTFDRSVPVVLPVLVDPAPTDSPHVRFLCCISSKLIRLPPHPPPLLMQPFAPGSLVLLSPPQVAVRRTSKAGTCPFVRKSICNLSQSFPVLAILVPFWSVTTFLLFFYLRKLRVCVFLRLNLFAYHKNTNHVFVNYSYVVATLLKELTSHTH